MKKNEIQKAIDAGMKPMTLGRRILRTETAGMTDGLDYVSTGDVKHTFVQCIVEIIKSRSDDK